MDIIDEQQATSVFGLDVISNDGEHRVYIKLPEEVRFSDLQLNIEADQLVFNDEVFQQVFRENNLSDELLTSPYRHENVVDIIFSWYFFHRVQGGAPDLAAEQAMRIRHYTAH